VWEPVLPGKHLTGPSHIPVTPHGNDRELGEVVHVAGEADCLIDVVIPAKCVGKTHTEENDPEPGGLKVFHNLVDLLFGNSPHRVREHLATGSDAEGIKELIVMPLFDLDEFICDACGIGM